MVDNYLKKSIKRSTRSSLLHTNGNTDSEANGDSSVLYSTASNKDRRYKRFPAEDEESESDVLLGSTAQEQEPDSILSNGNNTLTLLVEARSVLQPKGTNPTSVGSNDDVSIIHANDQLYLLTD